MSALCLALCQEPPKIVPGAPWPIVWECHSNTKFHPGHICQQSDGSHDHEWIAWADIDQSETYVSGPGVPVRCKTCGGRKCDMSTCLLRRHHGGDHERF